MRISSRIKQLSLAIASVSLASCANSLPEAPMVLEIPAPPPVAPSDAPAPTAAVREGELQFEVLHKATYNPFNRDNGKSFRALTTAEIYRAELGRHSIETPKPVDFVNSQVLVSSSGEKPTGGYKVTVTRVQEYDANVVVTVLQTSPGPACITTQSITHPFEFVLIPSLKPIEIFERQQVDEECQ